MNTGIKQAVILAGGLGSRLGEISKKCPKPILPVAGKPFLLYLIENLRRFGISDFVICVGYLGQMVSESLGNGSDLGVRISYSFEDTPLDTGGCLKHALDDLDDRFLVLNGDTYFDFNYSHFLSQYSRHFSSGFLIALRRVEDVSRYGAIEQEGARISSLQDKSMEGPGWINGGVYILDRSTVEGFPEGTVSLEKDFFPELATQGRLFGIKYDGFFIDIGIPETYESSQFLIPQRCKKPIVFLDRDGVINVNHGYVASPERFEFVPGAQKTIRSFNENGFYVIVVTNQAGIARGLYSEHQFHAFMHWIQLELRKDGAHIDGYYYSPNHPEGTVDQYIKNCFFRKPNPGMLLRALSEWPTVVEDSLLIGDKKSDITAAEKAGINAYLFEEKNLHDFCQARDLL